MTIDYDEELHNYPKTLDEIKVLKQKLVELEAKKLIVETLSPRKKLAAFIQEICFSGCYCGEYNDRPKIIDLESNASKFLDKLRDLHDWDTPGMTEDELFEYAKELLGTLRI